MKRWIAWLASSLFAVTAPAWAAAPNGALLAGGCTACHGTAGGGESTAIPAIGGQLKPYIAETMQKFKRNQRPGTIMARVAKAYSDAEINALAEYFSKQPFVRPAQATDSAKIAAGKIIYQKRCKDCHLDSGRQSDHEAALLAGQRLEYLRIQTTDFLSNKRAFPDMMDEAYEGLTKDDLEAVSHYFASQR